MAKNIRKFNKSLEILIKNQAEFLKKDGTINVTKAAKEIGITQPRLRAMLRGNVDSPKKHNVEKIIEALNVNYDQIMGYELYPWESKGHHANLPQDQQSSGQKPPEIPSIKIFSLKQLAKYDRIDMALSDISHHHDIAMSNKVANPSRNILIEIKDESMSPDLIPSDVVLVDLVRVPEIGDNVLVKIEKEYQIRTMGEDGVFIPKNNLYKTKTATTNNVAGLCMSVIRNLK